MPECPFCRRLAAEGFEYPLWKNEHALAVLSEQPARPGNCIVIAKRHVESISLLTADEVADVYSLITCTAAALETALGAEKTYLISISDQVPHLHFHLLPKLTGQISMGCYCFDKLVEAEGRPAAAEAELAGLAERLRRI